MCVDEITRLRSLLSANPALCSDPAAIGATDIVVPIFNAFDCLLECLESVARSTSTPFRLILIDDASTDPRVGLLLDGLSTAPPGVVVLRRVENRGFVHSVNEGFSCSSGNDVLLLNSDTCVTSGWLEKLRKVAYSRPDVATVTPLTNNGTICAVPRPLDDNEIPDGYDVDSFAGLVDATSFRLYPEAPTGVGFCLYVRREALNAVGLFDAAAFGRGYGEENDFCQRAIRAGLVNLIADDTFVCHKGSSSFGPTAAALLNTNLERVAERHPAYLQDVARFIANHPLRAYHEYLQKSVDARRPGDADIRMRVLHVLHQGGGTEKHARDLAAIDARDILSFVATSDGIALRVDEYYAGCHLRRMRFPLPLRIPPGELQGSGYDRAFDTLLWSLRIDLVHVHHLMSNDISIARVAETRGIPYVVTLHDYYALCPSYTLLGPDGRPCYECRTGRLGPVADDCMKKIGRPASYLHEYQALTRMFLRGARMLFAPNPSMKEIFAEAFPELSEAIHVVEHGHRLQRLASGRSRQSAAELSSGAVNAALKVAVIGGLDPHKGLHVFKQLARTNRSDRLVFHFYGSTPDAEMAAAPVDHEVRLEGSRFIYHGPYDASDIVARLVRDRIDVGLQPAIWPEAFSYTLSEFVQAHVPVLVGNLGAQADRTRRFRLGWVVDDIHDTRSILGLLEQLSNDRSQVARAVEAMARDAALRSLEAMWRDYVAAYNECLRGIVRDEEEPMAGNDEQPYSREYVAYLAGQIGAAASEQTDRAQLAAQLELQALRERLHSPRHRIADWCANAIQSIPLIWPMIARTTDAVLRWEARRRRPS
jgi:GT2 family glycosyltransferase/glycosyltransferase involved in cell wall biosynthesis